MAKRRRKRNGNKPANPNQAKDVMELIREGTALQIELLGAAARTWSEIVESVANYNQELTSELMKFSAGTTDANMSIEHLVEEGKKQVRQLQGVPQKIGKEFQNRVRRRVRAGTPTD